MTPTAKPVHQPTKPNHEQQLEIDRQLASRLQEIEIARVNAEHRQSLQQN